MASTQQIAPSYTHVMAFDFGSQKMGVAIGTTLSGSATPLALIPMRDGIPNWPDIDILLNQWQPDACLVGNPMNMDGSISEMSLRAQKFARRLAHRITQPVWLVDERLSTREARTLMADYQLPANTPLDSVAAMILLYAWFSEPLGMPL